MKELYMARILALLLLLVLVSSGILAVVWIVGIIASISVNYWIVGIVLAGFNALIMTIYILFTISAVKAAKEAGKTLEDIFNDNFGGQ